MGLKKTRPQLMVRVLQLSRAEFENASDDRRGLSVPASASKERYVTESRPIRRGNYIV